jgi:hypothetical protein
MEANDRYIVTDSGVWVHRDWREAVRGIDVDLPAIRIKGDPEMAAPKDIFQRGKARGLCKVCSTHSEDALTWILFRSLDRAGRLTDFLNAWFPGWPELGPAVLRHTLYWGRRPGEWEIDPHVARALRELEPYHAASGRQHTETDFAAALSTVRVQAESKLGTGTGSKSGWEKSKGSVRLEVPGARSEARPPPGGFQDARRRGIDPRLLPGGPLAGHSLSSSLFHPFTLSRYAS